MPSIADREVSIFLLHSGPEVSAKRRTIQKPKGRYAGKPGIVRSGMHFTDAVVPNEWVTETLAYAEFHGGQAETAPLTWAQRLMWRAAAASGPQHAFMNLRRTVPVSPHVQADLASVVRAVGTLVSRHGSLRTRVRPVDGEPRQETAPAGRLPVLLAEGEGDGATTAAALAERMGDVGFDHATEWPLRVALVLVGDRVRQIVFVFSHSTVDAHAVEVVLRDLRLILLRGTLTTPPGLQSVEVARQQYGADRHRSTRAVEHWLRQYQRLPQLALEPTGPDLTPRLHRGVLVSTAINRAAALIAARHRVSVSAVLLAATTALAAGESGRTACGLFTMAHNRFRSTYANAVANLGQIGFCVVDLADRPDFTGLLTRIWQASLDGYRYAYYDPAELRQRFDDFGYDYSTAFFPHYYFNDVRLPGADITSDATENDLRTAMEATSFSWTRGLDRASWHLLTHVVDEPGAVGITLSVDTRFLSPEWVEPFLRNLEELVVQAAFREVPWPWSPMSRSGQR